jgi:hypothetical protein
VTGDWRRKRLGSFADSTIIGRESGPLTHRLELKRFANLLNSPDFQRRTKGAFDILMSVVQLATIDEKSFKELSIRALRFGLFEAGILL